MVFYYLVIEGGRSPVPEGGSLKYQVCCREYSSRNKERRQKVIGNNNWFKGYVAPYLQSLVDNSYW